jgi:hypothetical protein
MIAALQRKKVVYEGRSVPFTCTIFGIRVGVSSCKSKESLFCEEIAFRVRGRGQG